MSTTRMQTRRDWRQEKCRRADKGLCPSFRESYVVKARTGRLHQRDRKE